MAAVLLSLARMVRREPLDHACQADGCQSPATIVYLRSSGVRVYLCRSHKSVGIWESR